MNDRNTLSARLATMGAFAFTSGLCAGLSKSGSYMEWQVMAIMAAMAATVVALTFKDKRQSCSQSPTFGPHAVDKKAMSRGAAPACMWCGKPMKVRFE